MQFCKPHWDALRDAVEQRGMSHLVARSGQQAHEDAVAQLEGSDDLQNWDPLMAAHWAISSRVLRAVGLDLMFGQKCPLCLVQQDYEAVMRDGAPEGKTFVPAQYWIDSCMDSMLVYARDNGLVSGVQ